MVSVREYVDAAEVVGDFIVDAVCGSGGLSGAARHELDALPVLAEWVEDGCPDWEFLHFVPEDWTREDVLEALAVCRGMWTCVDADDDESAEFARALAVWESRLRGGLAVRRVAGGRK